MSKIISIQQISFPINTEIIIPKDDSVRLLFEVTEGLNYSNLYRNYSTIGRNPVIEPKTLFRILVYGYMEKIYSSRALEKDLQLNLSIPEDKIEVEYLNSVNSELNLLKEKNNIEFGVSIK